LLEKLREEFDIVIFVSDEISEHYLPGGVSLERYTGVKRSKKLFGYVLDPSLLRNFRKSSSFSFRLKRYLFGDYARFGLMSPTGLTRLSRSLVFAIPGCFWLLRSMYIRKVLANKELVSETRKSNPV